MTVTRTVQPVDFVAIKTGDELTIEAADLAAEMLVQTYVPEYDPRYMTFQEALDEAILRDERATSELEASIKAALAEDEAEDDLAAEMVDLLLANTKAAAAERADREEREANGPWEVIEGL